MTLRPRNKWGLIIGSKVHKSLLTWGSETGKKRWRDLMGLIGTLGLLSYAPMASLWTFRPMDLQINAKLTCTQSISQRGMCKSKWESNGRWLSDALSHPAYREHRIQIPKGWKHFQKCGENGQITTSKEWQKGLTHWTFFGSPHWKMEWKWDELQSELDRHRPILQSTWLCAKNGAHSSMAKEMIEKLILCIVAVNATLL